MKHFGWKYTSNQYWIYPLPYQAGLDYNNLEFEITENFANEILIRRIVEDLDRLVEDNLLTNS